MKIKELINANKIYSKPKINGNNLTQKENEHKTKNTSLSIRMKSKRITMQLLRWKFQSKTVPNLFTYTLKVEKWL